MRLNKNELKKIQYDFNSFSNRLLQANYQDYTDVLGKFLKFIDSTPVIIDYIKDCGECNCDVADEVTKVQSACGRFIFSIGDTENEEVRNVYAVLRYLVDTNNSIYYGVALGYSNGSKYQEKIKGFNDRFVMVLIRHIERYLTKVGIDMGLDDQIIYNVSVQNGQAIIATDHANVTATNNIGINSSKLTELIDAVKSATTNLTPEEKESVAESLEVIETELLAEKPKKSMLKTAITTLQTIKGIAEFCSAVAALIQFAGPYIG